MSFADSLLTRLPTPNFFYFDFPFRKKIKKKNCSRLSFREAEYMVTSGCSGSVLGKNQNIQEAMYVL
jgi:hypothetical protein